MKTLIQALIAFALLIFALGASGCGGTETGNPGLLPNPNPTQGQPQTNFQNTESYKIMSAVCNKIIVCQPTTTLLQCQNGVLAQTNLPGALGLPSTFGTLQQVTYAEAAGLIVPNVAYSSTCVNNIVALVCGSTTVSTSLPPATSAGSVTSYSNVVNMIPTSSTSCKGVF